MIIKRDLFDPLMKPLQVHLLPVKVGLRVMTMKDYSIFSGSLELEPRYQIQFSLITLRVENPIPLHEIQPATALGDFILV